MKKQKNCALHAAKCKEEKSEKIVSDLCTKFLFPPTKQGVCRTVALPFIFKKYLEGKRRTMKIQIFHHAKNIIFKKEKSSTRNQKKSFKIFQLYN
jgi:hypothetical protein